MTVRAAADAFLGSLRNPSTVRSYGVGVGKTAERIGEGRPLGLVADDEVGEALELLWGTAAVNTWNARRAAVLSWLGWCAEYGYEGPGVPGWTKRLAVPESETPARSKMAVDRLIARREVHLREKTLWRMLYESAGRSEEILGVNIEDLDLAGRRCRVKAKGAHQGRRALSARSDKDAPQTPTSALPLDLEVAAELRGRGVGYTSLHENLDTTTPGGRLVLHAFAALAEFIRELIVIGSKEGPRPRPRAGRRTPRRRHRGDHPGRP